MRIAYTTTFDARAVHNWSGTPFHMANAFQEAGVDIDYIGNLKRNLPRFFKARQLFRDIICDQRESPRFNCFSAQAYSQQVAMQLKKLNVDAIVSPLINPIAYLDTHKPIALWTDALYAALVGFYPPFSKHSARTIMEGNAITQECLARCRLAIFSSDWAARSALELYGTSREKVHVVPFGANLESEPTYPAIQEYIANRDPKKLRLLFLAKSWERKGGDIVLKVTHALHAAGYPVELTIVGYHPPELKNNNYPYIHTLGFISKRSPLGKAQIESLLANTHFLFVPSRAEAYGIVFCEANAFAVPCLTTYVGGIGTIVKDNFNGLTFGLDDKIQTYCERIVALWESEQRYKELALSSYNEFTTRLNWKVAVGRVKELLGECL